MIQLNGDGSPPQEARYRIEIFWVKDDQHYVIVIHEGGIMSYDHAKDLMESVLSKMESVHGHPFDGVLVPYDEQSIIMPHNGCRLYWRDNGAGGRTYFSDEVGSGVVVWDTCSVDESTLKFAMEIESKLDG